MIAPNKVAITHINFFCRTLFIAFFHLTFDEPHPMGLLVYYNTD